MYIYNTKYADNNKKLRRNHAQKHIKGSNISESENSYRVPA